MEWWQQQKRKRRNRPATWQKKKKGVREQDGTAAALLPGGAQLFWQAKLFFIAILLQFICLCHHKIIHINVRGGGMGTLWIFALSDVTLNKIKAMKGPNKSSSSLWNLKWAGIFVQPYNKSVSIKSGQMHTQIAALLSAYLKK